MSGPSWAGLTGKGAVHARKCQHVLERAIGGIAALVGTPIVYRLRAANAHASVSRNWLWPTWWMLVPLIIVIVGLIIARVPQSFDLRRSILRSRLFARRRGR